MNLLLHSWQRPIHFAIAHAAFIGTLQIVIIGYANVDAASAQPFVKVREDFPLNPLRIIESFLQWRSVYRVPISRIRAVVRELLKTGFLKEVP